MTFCFYGFISDFLEFPSVKSSKFVTAHRIHRDTNFKHEKSRACKGRILGFCNVVLYHYENIGIIDFPKKRTPTKIII